VDSENVRDLGTLCSYYKTGKKIGRPILVIYGLRESAAERFGLSSSKRERNLTVQRLPEEPRRKMAKTTVFPLHGIFD
jgi:hypothetical protein